jgi:hypothetical protein
MQGKYMYGNANQGMDEIILFQILSFFNESILSDIFQSSQHFLILDGHGSHVMLETIA